MKTLYYITLSTLLALPVYAGSAKTGDNSDLFVYIFLSFCALIVIFQLVPTVMMLLGLKRSWKQDEKLTPKSV